MKMNTKKLGRGRIALEITRTVTSAIAGVFLILGSLLLYIDEAYIRQSIEKPDAGVRKGFDAMPSFEGSLSPREITALVEFLAHGSDAAD